MPIVNVDELIRLQRKTEDVRNICILAHVDHGKTSLTDSLIATNGIISPKLAGKIRYLDSRPDEQTRGITMESSAISLYYPMLRRPAPDAAPQKKEYLVNLIDSPGHIDFSSEVSTASRLCDGALVLVDAVEGVCSQTVTVLRHTWVEQLRPILVINKLDRLVTELKMSAEEAYAHMTRLLEQVNAVIGSFYQGERMEEDLQWRERMEERVKAAAEEKDRAKKEHPSAAQADADSAVTEYKERDDEDLYFSPEKNNVIFCSATDGWAFTVRQFASMYEKKLGIKRAALEKCLWGDYYLDPKTKRVLGQKHLKGRNLKPTFVQLVLDTIWAVYNATIGGDNGKGDSVLLEKITKSLGITIPPYVLRSRDPRATLTTIFSSWLPLSNAVLITVIEYLPNPLTSQAARMPNIIRNSPGSEAVSPAIEQAMAKFDSSPDAPVVAYVSKMVAIPESELPSATKRNGTGSTSAQEARELARKKREEIMKLQQSQASSKENDSFARISSVLQDTSLDEPPPEEPVKEDPEHLIGFARLYSGTLKVGDSVYVLPPKFNPAKAHTGPELKKVTITALYLLMGRNLEKLESVPAGSVFGIGGLQGQILKTGTLCSQVAGGINLAGVSLSSPPIVRVALEPVNPADLTKMITGLKLLEEADPCAQYEVLPNGEHVILTAGELHLERCLKDLRERFARCDITPGAPIVPYRETTVVAPDMPPPKNLDPQTQTPLARGTVISTSASRLLTLQLRVRPLPPAVTDFLVKHEATIKSLHAAKHGRQAAPVAASRENVVGENGEAGEAGEAGEVGEEEDDEEGRAIGILSADEFKKQLGQVLDQAGNESGDDVWKTVLDQVIEFGPRRMGANMLVDMTAGGSGERVLALAESGSHADHPTAHNLQLFSDKIAYAFQLAVARGPLCHEPVQGLAVLVERLVVADGAEDELGRLTGEIIRSVRDAVHQGLLDWSPRVMLAMYSCEIQASTEVLGRVYSVITRRRGRILSETMKEGTPFFTIVSLLPVAESFGFAEEMRKRTSGAASPQLIFSGFEMLDQDPFWVPATEEELEDLGELADRENVAKRYMDSVRERKGLAVKGKKLIKDAEKQKTLKR